MVAGLASRSSTKSRINRLIFTASRAKSAWPPPSNVTNRAPGIAAAIFCAWLYGTILSWVPCSARVGTATPASRSWRSTPSIARSDSTRISGVVSPAQATQSSIPLRE